MEYLIGAEMIDVECQTETSEQEVVQREKDRFQELTNDELAPVRPGTLEGFRHLFYCSRQLG
eukprot:9896667-Lingulodinium_polyedra.AAC.1